MSEPLVMLVPCSDHGCILRVEPGGMGTNGGCKCADQPTAHLTRRLVLALARDRRHAVRGYNKLDEECAALRARVALLEAERVAIGDRAYRAGAMGHAYCPPPLTDGPLREALAQARTSGAESMRGRTARYLRTVADTETDRLDGLDVDAVLRTVADEVAALPLTDATESEER